MHREMSYEYMVCVKNARYLWNFTKKNYPEIEDAAKVFYYNNCVQLINFIVLDHKRCFEKECRILRREILREKSFFIHSRYMELEEKCAIVCLILGVPLYRFVLRNYLWMKKNSGIIQFDRCNNFVTID